MTHQPGETITIASYNDIIAQVNAIFGTGTGSSGYGGNSVNVSVTDLPTVTSLTTIDNQEWLDLRNAQSDVAAHQGVALSATLPVTGDLESTDSIQAFDDQTGPDNPDGEIDSADNLLQIVTNKDLHGGETFSVIEKLISERITSWSSFIEHEFHVVFTDTDAARHFFNTGGELRFFAEIDPGTGSLQNAAWKSLVDANSPFIFDSSDYFALTSAFVTLRTVTDSGYYASNNWTISGKRDDAAGSNGGNGSVLRFKSSFLDGHTNVFADVVDGTFTSTIDENRAITIFPQTSPTFTTLTDLTNGS